MNKIIKKLVALIIGVAIFYASIWALLPKVTYLDGYVLPSSGSGYVQVQAEDGNIYECYGNASDIIGQEVVITLEGERFVHFEIKE